MKARQKYTESERKRGGIEGERECGEIGSTIDLIGKNQSKSNSVI